MERTQWLLECGMGLSERDRILLDRASRTLELNIVDPSQEGAPWAPLRGIRPSKFRYPGVWNWDSAFHAIAVAHWDGELAREQARIFFQAQQPSGGFIDVFWSKGGMVTDFGKPPVWPWAAAKVYERSGNEGFLAEAYRHFVANEAFWCASRGGDAEGLFHYDSAAEGPERKWEDAGFESGWDNSPRWDMGCREVWPVDLNCYMVLFYRALAYMAGKVSSQEEARGWRDKEAALIERIEAALWDENLQAYADVHRVTRKGSGVFSPASFMPLFAGFAPKERADRMAEIAASEEKFFPGMPTVSYDHPSYSRNSYWRGPTWLNVAYFALKGLKDYGYAEAAEEMRETILKWCHANDDHLYEYYDSRTGKGIGAKQFGWTAAFVIEFILHF